MSALLLTNIGSSGDTDVPITGEVRAFGMAAPSGWLACDGSAVSRTTYAPLFAAIGTAFGVGNGTTTFNVPDIRGRTPIGTGTGSGLTARALADSGGEETHVLLTGETGVPVHTHGITDPGHTHVFTGVAHNHGAAAGSFVQNAAGSEYVTTAGNKGTVSATDANATATGSNASNTTGITAANAVGASGSAHNNMQPYLGLVFAIKA